MGLIERLRAEADRAERVADSVQFEDIRAEYRQAARRWRKMAREAEASRVLWRGAGADTSGQQSSSLALRFGDVLGNEPDPKPDQDSDVRRAGPNGRPELANPEAMPGTGMVPPTGTPDERHMQPTS